MTIYALDPGPTKSHLVQLHENGHPTDARSLDNLPMRDLLAGLGRHWATVPHIVLVIEQVASMGKPVGQDVFSTVFWAGRFAETWEHAGGRWTELPRHAVKRAICHSAVATDATIRQALIDRYGGNRLAAVGTKRNPGPLYGIRADLWQALALAIAYQQQQHEHV